MKIRLDQYLVQHGLIQSRERAKAMIMAGVVYVNGQKADKAGDMVKEDAVVEVRGHDIGYVSRGGDIGYVSRGGLKLEKAMQVFPLSPRGKRPRSMRWTWATASWPGACAPTPGW